MRRWYDKPGVELNLANSPADTVVPADFTSTPVVVDALCTEATISAVFVASAPIAAAARPLGAAAFVGTRSRARGRPPRRAWRARGLLAW